MTTIDWIILAFTAAMAIWGYGQGLLVGLLSLGGFAAGAIIGARLGPMLLAGGAESPYAPLTALLGGLLLGALLAMTMEGIAQMMRHRLIRDGTGLTLDGLGGAILLGALALLLAWVLGAVALNTPGVSGLRGAIQRSAILQRLNTALPPSGPILRVLNRIDPTPAVRGPEARVPRPQAAIARDPDVRAAGQSIVRVLGTACGLGVSGSGWVAGPGIVVTNAHVVAGQDDTTVTPLGDGTALDATAVRFDVRNDVAILRVAGLDARPLPLSGPPERGTPAAVLGFPENGPFEITPARIGRTGTVVSQDAYGRGPVRREMTSFRGQVRSGNSGGPVVDEQGSVLATVFASAVGENPPSGLGVPDDIVRRDLARADGPVDTGPCAR